MKCIIDPPHDQWEAFQSRMPWAQFTQSWAWGSFRGAEGNEVVRVACEGERGSWLAAAQIEFRERRGGLGYWYMPRGPVFSPRVPVHKRRKLLQRFFSELDRAGLKPALFWRVEPVAELKKPEGLLPMVAKRGQPFAFKRVSPLNPSSTRLIDLTKDTEALLQDMHHKTRYNIHVAEKHGVTVRLADGPDDIERFLALIRETSERAAFVPQPTAYLRDMIRMLAEREMLRVRIAERGGEILAASVEILYGDTVTYLHGGSASEGRETMAPYRLHWEAIQQAKQEGFLIYDFWGENPESSASAAWKESWSGITRFKRGWGGRHVDLYGTWDLPRSAWLYRLLFFTRKKRGTL